MQERFEASPAGRWAISVFVIVMLVSVVIWNLPESEIRRKSMPLIRPFIFGTALEQNWGVFAPNPRAETIDLVARVEFADGTEETLHVPRGGSLVGGYWDYRWWKWVERVISDQQEHLWEPGAVWFARRASEGGRQPVRVTLVRRWYTLNPPGPGPDRGEWQEFAYYTLRVADPPATEAE